MSALMDALCPGHRSSTLASHALGLRLETSLLLLWLAVFRPAFQKYSTTLWVPTKQYGLSLVPTEVGTCVLLGSTATVQEGEAEPSGLQALA